MWSSRYKQLLAALEERQGVWDQALTTCKDECLARVSNMAAAHRDEVADLRAELNERDEKLDHLNRSVNLQKFELERSTQKQDEALQESLRESTTLRRNAAEREEALKSLALRVGQLDDELLHTRKALAAAESKVAMAEDKARLLGAGLDGLRRQADLGVVETGTAQSFSLDPSTVRSQDFRSQDRAKSADLLSQSLERLLKSVSTPKISGRTDVQ